MVVGVLHELLLAVLDDEELVGGAFVPGVLLRLGEDAVDDGLAQCANSAVYWANKTEHCAHRRTQCFFSPEGLVVM